MKKIIYVRKRNGILQPYDPSKIKNSLLNAGANTNIANKITKAVEKFIYNGITTKELFEFVFKKFREYEPYTSSRYNLKHAILDLGIAGFPFEKFIAKIFETKGYSVSLNGIIKGKYITHEIDVSATKQKEKIMIECKHHSKPWLGCHIQVALYVYARFLDLKKKYTKPMLITNTKFSPQVIKYSKGVGLNLMGWRYPKKDSLEKNIEKFKLYPVTLLNNINQKEGLMLLNLDILFIEDLKHFDTKEISNILNIPITKSEKILEEVTSLSKQ